MILYKLILINFIIIINYLYIKIARIQYVAINYKHHEIN